MKKIMLRKAFVVISIFIIVGIFIPSSISYEPKENRFESQGIEFLKPYLFLEYNTSYVPYICEIDFSYLIPVNISYHVGGLLSRLITRLLPYMMIYGVQIHLSLLDVPEWCNAYISQETIYSEIDYRPNEHICTSSIVISLSDEAPAWEEFSIGIKAMSESVIGPFGLITIIPEKVEIINLSLVPGFLCILEYENAYVVTPPLETTNVTLNMTNLGNGDIQVVTSVIDLPEGFIINVPPLTVIPVDSIEPLLFQIMPPEDFYNKVELIEICYNVSSYGHPEAGYYEYTGHIRVQYP